MNLFNRNRPSRIRKACQTGGPDVQFEEPEIGVAACESARGELRPRTVQAGGGKTFSKMYGGGSSLTPRKGGITLRTK